MESNLANMLMLERMLYAQRAGGAAYDGDEDDEDDTVFEDAYGRRVRVLPLNTTFVLSTGSREQCDAQALGVLATRFAEGVVPARLRPLATIGDGSCFLHAVSTYLWGTEEHDDVLRQFLVDEVKMHKSFYVEHVVSAHMQVYSADSDLRDPAVRAKRTEELYRDLVASCEGRARMRDWIGLDEVFVLANAIQRPIIVYAAQPDIAKFGEGLMGVGGAFLPLRHPPEKCATRSPVLISWSNLGLHFCPVVRVAGWNASRFDFPPVRPALCSAAPVAAAEETTGDPPCAAAAAAAAAAASEEDTEIKEQELMARYVDYWEELHAPPCTHNGLDQLASYSVPGLERTQNPADGAMYDVVVPVDLGRSVDYVAFNLGEVVTTKLQAFAERHDLTHMQLQAIVLYTQKVLKALHRAGRRQQAQGAAAPPRVRLCDVVPQTVQHSLVCATPEAPDLALSLDVFPSVPLRVPRLFDTPLACRAMEQLHNDVAAIPGAHKNTFLDIVYTCIAKVGDMLKRGPAGPDEFPLIDFDVTDKQLLQTLATTAHDQYTHYEVLRYIALVPPAAQFLGPTLVSWGPPPSDAAPFCAHLAFVQLLANVLGNQGVVTHTWCEDVLARLTESRAHTAYLARVSRSRSPDLLTALSVLLLNIAVASDFSPMNTLVAQLYPRVLATALQQACVPLLRNVLLGLATLMHNDAAATALLATCAPLERLLAAAESLDPGSAPYACFCTSLVQMARGCI